jgi:hypothetical protein
MSKPPRISGLAARPYVQAKKAFTNHNGQLFGRWETPLLYAVYSYGDHWPLFIHDGFDWYENEDKYSPTTSKHRTQTHPHGETIKVSRTWLRTMIANRRSDHRQMERLQDSLLEIAA